MTIPPGHYMQTGKRLYPMNRVPGWLAEDKAWRDKLEALTDDDVAEFDRQWTLAGGSEHWDVDDIWVTTENINGLSWWDNFKQGDSALIPVLLMLAAVVVCFGLPMIFVGGTP